MNVEDAIRLRRAYRSLDPVMITEDLIKDLAEKAGLAPSCFNNQPWRFIFVHDPQVLRRLHASLSRGNEWARDASMIVAVFTKRELDCVVRDREYYLFDVGMATAFMILRATELGLVAHPIAGFNEEKIKEILNIPRDMRVITLLIIGKHSSIIRSSLTPDQVEREKSRPQRLPLESFIHLNIFQERGSI
ncbi:MAG: nitroreductase family protein [Candidatus Bathyarchaeia archaeon]|nr:nitroreductase family protein [Candidatus Bathyarchaeota archaeon]